MIDFVLSVFWNNQEDRLRALWRLAIQMFLFFMVSLVSGVIPFLLGKDSPWALLQSVLYLVFGVALIWLVGWFLDRRRIRDYGYHLTRGWWMDFGFGLLLGVVLMTGVFACEQLAGWIDVSTPLLHEGARPVVKVLLVSGALYFTVALMEEFLSRGYQLRNLAEGMTGRWIGPRTAIVAAWLISSCFFGLLHALNPNASAVSTVNIMLAGLLLGLPYILTGELGISIGLHLTWNFFQGTVYGFPVSGYRATRGLLTVEQSGPKLWTGGKFGPEGGLIGIAAIIVGCVLVIAWVKLRHRRVAIDVAVSRYQPGWLPIPTREVLATTEPPTSLEPPPQEPHPTIPTI